MAGLPEANLPLLSQKALQWVCPARDLVCTPSGVMWSAAGYVLELASDSEEECHGMVPQRTSPWGEGGVDKGHLCLEGAIAGGGTGSYLTLGCVGHSPHRGDHGEGAGRLIGVLLPRDRVIRK